MNKPLKNPYSSREDMVKDYIKNQMELVRLELVLDNLFMSTEKDEEWKEKHTLAQKMYDDKKEQVEFLSALFMQERMKFVEENEKSKKTNAPQQEKKQKRA